MPTPHHHLRNPGLGDHVNWSEGAETNHPTAIVTNGPFTHHVTVGIDPDGRLESVSLPRWGNPDDGAHREHVFGVAFDGDQQMAGYRVPRNMRAGWWFGTPQWPDGEFFRATIDSMEFF